MLVLKRRLALLVTMTVLWTSAGAMAAGQPEITLADRNGQQAAMTPFTVDGVSAWWAQLPPESGFDQLSLTVDGTGYVPGDGTPVDAPDAGESPDQAAYVSVMAQNARGSWQEAARLYVSHSPYTPAAERSYRNVRAVGKWGRISGSTRLLDDPGASGRTIGTLEDRTRVLVLYTCRSKGVEYACVQVGSEACFVRSNSVRMLSDTVNLAFDLPQLSERRNSGDVKLARAAYKTSIRSALGSASDAVLETAPVDTVMLVLTSVSFKRVQYDLVYRLDNGTVGFAHDSQLAGLSAEEAAAALAAPGESPAGPYTARVQTQTALRVFPAADAGVAALLEAGTDVTVYARVEGDSETYCLVEVQGTLGYAAGSALAGTAEAAAAPEPVTVRADLSDALYGSTYEIAVHEAVLYTEPAYGSAAARVIYGERVSCTAERDGWIRVSTENGAEGWMPRAFAVRLRLGDDDE